MSVTYRHARTFTFGDLQLTLEIGNSRKGEKGREREGGGRARREKACETIYDVECVRIDGVRLMATLVHDIVH